MLKMANLISDLWLAIFIHLYVNSNRMQYDVMVMIIPEHRVPNTVLIHNLIL
jgi:hypothetical protein